jgi:tetratricopeptide (TPR) repeat protein
MRTRLLGCAGLLWLVVLAGGCAGALGEGQAALRHGDYRAATRHFEDVLSERPEELAARFGLGVALYELRDLDGATKNLERVVASAPRNRDAHLYLALAALRRGDQASAGDRLRTFRALGPHPRILALAERALALIGAGPLSAEVRDFVATAFEAEIEWQGEVREARLAPRAYLEPTWTIYRDRLGGYPYTWPPYLPHTP